MAQKRFSQLKIGDKFIYQGKTYIRIKDIRVSCCVIKYNAKTEDGSTNIKVPLHVVVELINV